MVVAPRAIFGFIEIFGLAARLILGLGLAAVVFVAADGIVFGALAGADFVAATPAALKLILGLMVF